MRTPAGYAFTVLTTFLTRRRDPLPAPVLLAGAEEDAALAHLVGVEHWPSLPPEAVASRAFRTELRSLLARAGELKVNTDRLAALGRELRVPLWGPASELREKLVQVQDEKDCILLIAELLKKGPSRPI